MDTCKQWTEKVTDHLEGAQGWTDWAQFRLHVLMCPPCRDYLRQVELAVETLHETPETEVPDDVREGLLRRYREWQGERASE